RVQVLLALFLACGPASSADSAGFAWSGGRALAKAPSEKDQDEVEEATTEASERAVGLRFCSLKSHCILWPLPLLVQGEQLQKTAPENEDLAAARRARDRAENAVVRADKAVTALGDVVAALWGQWLQEFSTNKTKADEVNQERKDAETKLEDAKQELNVAETKLQNAQQKYEAKASAQAGPAQ
ncbi:unnamed protein product, partial [Symbiodinium microadriaticum]